MLFSVLNDLRLSNGILFSIPITLDVSEQDIKSLKLAPNGRLVLRDLRDDAPLAIITIQDIYRPDKVEEATKVFGSNDLEHPSVKYLRTKVKEYYIGGNVEAIQAPTHYDYVAHRRK